MRPNLMRSRWESGLPAVGAWLSIGNSFTAELMARSDFDYICVDTQHGVVDYNDSWLMLQAVNLGKATPLARVPWNEPGVIGKSLDAGARGIVVPMVDNRQQAEAAVRACRYPPAGNRSYGPVRALRQEGTDYYTNANADVSVIPMIETAEAISNLDDILSVRGVDATYVGPSDLSLSLGLPPGNNDGDPSFDEALEAILDGCRRHGVIAGIHTTSELFHRRVEQGFRLVTITSDVVALTRGVDYELARARSKANRTPQTRAGSIY